MSQVYTNYVKTGKVKVVFKDFQFLGNDSMAGAEYGRAVWELYPDQYYTWYQAMFTAQDQEGDQGFGNMASIDALVKKQLGSSMDVTKIDALITQKKSQYDTAIMADRSEGASMGINGTPAIIVGTQLLSGAQSYEAVSALIDAQLKK
jgi:protein-disulfide isomerase